MNQSTLLSGNIRRQILTLAVPLLFGNILQQFYNTADSLIVGKFLGSNAFASVGISGSLMNLFIFILDGFCAGITVILGQLYGTGDRKKYREEVFTALLLGIVIALIISGVCTAFLDPILKLINTPDELVPYAESYLFIILAGLPFTCLYNLFPGSCVPSETRGRLSLSSQLPSPQTLPWTFSLSASWASALAVQQRQRSCHSSFPRSAVSSICGTPIRDCSAAGTTSALTGISWPARCASA